MPIFKSGDKSDVGNYRPISVLPIVSKIIERAVHDQLYMYAYLTMQTFCQMLNLFLDLKKKSV